jgi:ABC-type dipeptide/oligopeptide/nickel transport system permease component
LITGIVGIISGCRKSYTILYSYYALLVLSILMPIFLIVYYSIMIAYYQKFSTNKQPSAEMWNVNNRPDTGDQSYALVASNLALSCATFVLSLVTVFFVCSAGKIGLRLKDYVDIYGNPKPPSYGYVNY